MKNILILHPELCMGGAEKVLINLLHNIDFSKYNIKLLLRNPELWDKSIPAGIEIKYLFSSKPTIGKIKARLYKYSLIFFPGLIYKLFGHGGNYDIAIAFHEPMIWYLPHINATKRVSWVHSDYSVRSVCPEVKTLKNKNGILAKIIENKRRKLIQSLDRIVFVAHSCMRSYIDYNLISEKKCNVVHNINNESEILAKAEEAITDNSWNSYNGDHLLVVGRINHEKAMHRLIPLMKHLANDNIDVKMFIIGDGNERCKLEELIKINGVEDYFYILGYKSNPYKYIKASKLLICCSPSEAYCTVTKEALILGTPFVTTACSGMQEQIGDSLAGIIVPQGEDTLYPTVKKILHNECLYKHMKIDTKKRQICLSDKQSLNEFNSFVDNI